MESNLSHRPILITIAGPNGAGKSTFYEAHLAPAGLLFVNADLMAKELGIDAYEAARMAGEVRQQLVARRESFVLETVLSDPQGAKVEFLRAAVRIGYTVLLYFVGLDSALTSDRRVSVRVLQGGHDVPTDKLMSRYSRTLDNLTRALKDLPWVIVHDNSASANPFRFVAEYREGVQVRGSDEIPVWFHAVTARQDA